MVIELQTVLSQEPKCLCSKTNTALSEWTVTKTMDVSLLRFYCIRKQKYLVEMYLYIQYTCTPTVH